VPPVSCTGATCQTRTESVPPVSPASEPNRCHPSVQPARPKLVPPSRPNSCHPLVVFGIRSWCHPPDGVRSGRRSNRYHIAVESEPTTHVSESVSPVSCTRISKSVPPVIPTSSFQPGRRVRIGATRQLRSREHPNWYHPSVEFGRRRRMVPPPRRMVPPPCSKKARRPCFGARFS